MRALDEETAKSRESPTCLAQWKLHSMVHEVPRICSGGPVPVKVPVNISGLRANCHYRLPFTSPPTLGPEADWQTFKVLEES